MKRGGIVTKEKNSVEDFKKHFKYNVVRKTLNIEELENYDFYNLTFEEAQNLGLASEWELFYHEYCVEISSNLWSRRKDTNINKYLESMSYGHDKITLNEMLEIANNLHEPGYIYGDLNEYKYHVNTRHCLNRK